MKDPRVGADLLKLYGEALPADAPRKHPSRKSATITPLPAMHGVHRLHLRSDGL